MSCRNTFAPVRLFSVVICMALCAAAMPAAAAAATYTFAANQDTRLEQANPNTPRGQDPVLRAVLVSGKEVRTVLQFPVSGTTGTVTNAKLRLYVTAASADGPKVYSASTGWKEDTAVWNAAPWRLIDAAIADRGNSPVGWVEYDVKSVVKANGTYAFSLRSTTTDGIDFVSAEGASARRPQLVVTTAGDTTAPSAPSSCSAAAATTPGAINVSWGAAKDNVGVSKYQVLRDGSAVIASPTGLSHRDVVAAGTTHRYVIRALDAAGNTGAGCTTAAVTAGSETPTSPPPAGGCLSISYRSTVPVQGAVTGYSSTESKLGNVAAPIKELSGLAAHRTGSSYWTHNDSGDDARIFAMSGTGAVIGTYYFKNASGARYKQGDFEEIDASRGCSDGKNRVIVGNVGSSAGKRELLVMNEPTSPSGTVDVTPTRINLDFANFNCYSAKDSEGTMVDPLTDDVYLFEKCGNVNAIRMYAVTGAQFRAALASSSVQTIKPVPVLSMRTGSTYNYKVDSANPLQHILITGADISPNGRRIAVKTYEHTYVWERKANESVMDAMSRQGLVLKTRNAESVAFTSDSKALVQAGEGGGATIYKYTLPAPPSDWSTTAAASTTPAAPSSTELFRSTPDDAFVSVATGQRVVMNGANTRDAVSLGSTWTYSKERYATLKAAGFNSVRMPLDWDDFETSQGVFDAGSLATLDATIANAKAAGLYVILDPIHLKDGDRLRGVPAWAKSKGGDSVQIVKRDGKAWIERIATRYGSEPNVIAVDLVNEAKNDDALDQNRMIDMYNVLITAYRAKDPDKILILESQGGDSSVAGANFSRLVTKTNIVWSFHHYFAGGEDDGYNANGWVTGHQTWDGTSGYPTPNRQQLEKHLTVTRDILKANGLPLYIGEYGIGEGATNYVQWWTDMAYVLKKHNISRSAWEWHSNGTMSITNGDYTMKSFVPALL